MKVVAWVVAVLAIVGGAAWYMTQGGKRPATAAPAQPPEVTVSTPLQREIVEHDEFTGQFAAVDYVELRARVSGYLQEIRFTDGQMVNKGDLLFVIDPRSYEIQRATAKADVDKAQASLELADRELRRSAELRTKDFVAQSTYDQRLSTQRGAQASLDSARSAVRDAELNLDYTRITAPVAGRISRHQVSLGNLVSGGTGQTTLLTTIVSVDPVFFYFDMSEADFLSYHRAASKGQLASARDDSVKVEARLMDETTWSYQGRIDFVENQVDRGAGTIRIRASFPNTQNAITPGQFGRIRVPASEPYQALLVPDAAIVNDQSRKLVMTVKDDGTVEAKIVRPGPTYEGLRIIRGGLAATDRVIINGLVRARAGAKVTATPGKIELASSSAR